MNQEDSLCLKTQPHLSLEVRYLVLFHTAGVPVLVSIFTAN